jgi:uncharacterized membrane protein YphA (DoxX/SURF4 family)
VKGFAQVVKEYWLTAARILIGVLLIYSGWAKVSRPIEFFEIVINFYQVVPDVLVRYVAWILAWTEFVLGTFLTLGFLTNASAGILSGIIFLFEMVVGQAIVRRLPIEECGCFGGGTLHLSLIQTFTLEIVLFSLLLQIASSERHHLGLDQYLKRS